MISLNDYKTTNIYRVMFVLEHAAIRFQCLKIIH